MKLRLRAGLWMGSEPAGSAGWRNCQRAPGASLATLESRLPLAGAARQARALHFLTLIGGPLDRTGEGALVRLELAPPILLQVPVPSFPVATTTPGLCTV